jgi:Zn-dependent protease
MIAGMNIPAALYNASTWVLPVLFAITFHEAAHGYVAWRLGDDTAYRSGRVSFNPLRHVDRFGTIILPALLLILRAPFLFGYAKPVPVNFGRLNNPRRDMVWVALAGPATNVGLAIVAAILLHVAAWLPGIASDWFAANLQNAILINLILAVFNMLPIPPLDGGRVAVGILPDALAHPLRRLERTGLVRLFGLLFFVPLVGEQFGVRIDLFSWLIWPPVEFLLKFILVITGHR